MEKNTLKASKITVSEQSVLKTLQGEGGTGVGNTPSHALIYRLAPADIQVDTG